MSDVTRILAAIERGDVKAVDELFPLVYQELRQLAAQRMSKEKPGQTLQATALVHEAYLRLVGAEDQNWDGRTHFFSAAAEAMRRILVENARRKKRVKHGGGRRRVDLDAADLAGEMPSDDLIALDEALEKLSNEDKVSAELIKLRFFAFAFIIGLYALHRLAMIKEAGEVEEKIVAQELFTEVSTQVRTLSSIEGVKQMVSFPVSIIRNVTERMISNDNKPKN